jgi:HEAT repeat protein
MLEDPETRERAAFALARIPDAAGLEACVGALRSRYDDVRLAAIAALGNLGGEAAIAALCTLNNDPSYDIRCSAHRALAELVGE